MTNRTGLELDAALVGTSLSSTQIAIELPSDDCQIHVTLVVERGQLRALPVIIEADGDRASMRTDQAFCDRMAWLAEYYAEQLRAVNAARAARDAAMTTTSELTP